MTRALAIETSGRVGSVAIAEAGVVLEEREFPHGLKHAAQILTIINDLCVGRGWKPADVNELYVSTGPGSFTGLRIAVTLAKMLALATGVKIVAVPTIGVLAENAPAEAQHLIVVLDAKRDQIFTGRFERVEGAWVEREAARLDSLTAMIDRCPRPVDLIGEGIPYHAKFIPADGSVIVTDESIWRARACVVAKLGTTLAAAGRFADPLTLSPVYIRRPEAEEKREAAERAAAG